MDEKSSLLCQATEKVTKCVACDNEPPTGRFVLVWEIPMCGGCSVVARRSLDAGGALNARLARLIGRVLARKGVYLGDGYELQVISKRRTPGPAGSAA